MAAIIAHARALLWAAAAGLGAALLAMAYGFGRRAEQAQQMRQRMRGA